ncbi:hypothetical protein KXD93_30480 [Mucilaginibacter sp. BJC16-A38]|uniref:hypothetical protein n=1 Tax=Mucilaginibacter phenanthrenivorans TaxID=1234842 RepID=UPI0021587C84|nr:hypothetical protein [Mucilaginibacter phenanthrenivorans]MCR8562020.1 hypothetical protein [Mucilaginibacter phenanthrenivorans]
MLDAAAQTHDYWYDVAKTGGVYGALFVDKVADADHQLAVSAGEVVRRYFAGVNDSITNQPVTRAEFIWALKVNVAFMELAGFKSIGNAIRPPK